MSTESDPRIVETQDEISSEVLPSNSDPHVFASVDFAHVSGHRLLVYGWILGFTDQVESAFIQIGDTAIDLAARCIRIPRPDVSQHFSYVSSDSHGFYALLDLQHSLAEVDQLILSFTSLSGDLYENRWVIQHHDSFLGSMPESDLATLNRVLHSLPVLEMLRLSRLLSTSPDAGREGDPPTALPPPIQFEIDFCCVLEERILVICGWFLDPANDLLTVQVSIGNDVLDLLNGCTPIPRADIELDSSIFRPGRSSRQPGFLLAEPIPEEDAGAGEAIIAVTAKGANTVYLIRPLARKISDSKAELFAHLGRMDAGSAMVFIERLRSVSGRLPGMESLRNLLEVSHDRMAERLPGSIHFASRQSRIWLHIDKAILVADKGIFLSGWFFAENGRFATLSCHCGDATFAVNKNWVRHARPDVTNFLEAEGIIASDHEHGFTCYVATRNDDRPYWLSVVSEAGEERRMHAQRTEHPQSTLETVRSLLGTFHCDDREFRTLIDRQIGPAVKAVWDSRKKPAPRKLLQRFGKEATMPEVSIIVPLYGRWDFAELQMSQFANDPSFRNIDLIYVVDDPSIYDQFRNAAPNLFGVYRIPFTLAFPGTNLGFAGANNFGAKCARGRLLLLLNSDVLPKSAGWIPAMQQIYGTLETPGVLGVKLVYEDGTLQHAGIEFRRHAPWGGLWINDHPKKGLSAKDLKGTREVEAVTAACALIEAGLFRKFNGFSENYIIGDFEDSDLCLTARRAGYRNYVALDIELYHLERQSQNQTGDSVWRSNLTAYNCWLHNKRWSTLIEEITTAGSQSIPGTVSDDDTPVAFAEPVGS